MPSGAQYVWQAEHNEEVYRFLSQGYGFNDWEITVLFYAALHYVNAFLFRSNDLPHSHDDRQLRLVNNDKLRPLAPEYKELQDRCWEARYHVVRFTPDSVNDLYRDAYQPFRNHLRSLLDLPE